MMAICGGAVIPPLMGWVTDISSNVMGMSILLVCMSILLLVSIYALRMDGKNPDGRNQAKKAFEK